MIGKDLGPYRVLERVGAGGMGEVYRARDTKLNRDVAIKILPEALAADPERRARFEREAQAVAALSHPNILSIFDFGVEGGTPYAVMELLEGEALRARLAHGALPARKAVEIAAQIAEGLAAAHEKGIVHRDLKPENIFVTAEGRAKVLDFGLAKVAAPAVGPDAGTQLAAGQTSPGAVMGTVGYMSPEQVRGAAVDHRSDIFTFGVVLYEMLAGRQAFGRETATESMTAILKEDPPEIATGGSGPSPALQRIVQHCLEKKPGERFQSARDIAFALQALSGSGSGIAAAALSVSGVTRRVWRPWVIVGGAMAVAILLGVTGVALYRLGQRAQPPQVADATGLKFLARSYRRQAIFQAAFAPDGETIVYSSAREGNVPELFVIRPGYPEPQPLGLPRTHLLSISSRGELAVLTNARYVTERVFTGTLARLSLGSAPREMADGVRQADWSPDGSELAIIRASGGKDRLEFPIGKMLYETAGYLSDLRVSPRGDRIAVFEHPKQWDNRGSLILVDTAGRRTVLPGEYDAEVGLAWSRSGDEVLFNASWGEAGFTLYGVGLSGHRRVALGSAGGLTMHDVSRTGRWLVTRDDRLDQISVLAPGAGAERDLSWLDGSADPILSHDGRILLFTEWSTAAGPNYQVCLRKTDGGPVTALGEGSLADLSPDGKSALAIIFSPPQVVVYPVGPGETRRLLRGGLEAYQSATWFPDGTRVLVVGNEAGKATRCYEQGLSGGLPRPVTPEGSAQGSISQDGTQILYSMAAGSWLVQPVGGGTARAVPGLTADDQVIRWSADGRSVYVSHSADIPFRLERLDLGSGRRDLIREVAPPDRTGVLSGTGAALADDTRWYAYGYTRMTSQLFVVEGAR